MIAPDRQAVAQLALEHSRALGADEVVVRLTESRQTELGWRDGRTERSQESRSLSLRVSLLVQDRWSVHGTSDLRPDALRSFLDRAVSATRHLEPDPDRRLAPADQMGTVDPATLDLVDPAPPPDRAARLATVAEIEAQVRAEAQGLPLKSAAAHSWEGASESLVLWSNGHQGAHASTYCGFTAELTLSDAEGRLPEGYASAATRHRADLPSPQLVASEAVARARVRLGSRPARSGRYPMLVHFSRVGRVLGTLLTPFTGAALYEGRSCLQDAFGQTVSPNGFTLIDDPLVPRGMGSRPFDSDGLPARAWPLVQDGVLSSPLVDVYAARRLGRAPTTGGTSNLILPPGTRSQDELLRSAPQVMLVDGVLGGNCNAATGAFSFGVSGVLYENGAPVQNISEMNITGSLTDLLASWVENAREVWTFGSWRTPSVLFDAVQFSGS